MTHSTADVTIEYVDEIKCRVVASKEVLYFLREEYSFFVDGYKFNPKYKSGLWNGKIYMLDNKGLFYSGLLKDLIKKCKDKGLKVKVNDIYRYMPIKISDEELAKLFSYCKLSPYDYQQASVKEALSKRKLLVLSPTSSGKSAIIYFLYRYCVDNDIPLLITVPSTSLVEQIYSDFEDYVADDHVVSDHVAKMYSGQEKNPKQKVIISTWQSCVNKDKEWLSQFGFYIADEAHSAKSAEQSKIIDALTTCQYRIGLTGTLSGAEMHELEMHARFGDIFRMVTTRELIDRGIVTDIEIRVNNLIYSKSSIDHFYKYCNDRGKLDYQKEIDFLLNSDLRNNYLVNLANNLTTNTLMLFNKIEAHGLKLLEQLVENSIQYKKKIYYISGSIKPKDREIIRKTMDGELPKFYELIYDNGKVIVDASDVKEEKIKSMLHNDFDASNFDENNSYIYENTSGKLNSYIITNGSFILLATYGTLSTGVNIKNLHNLIFAHPFKGRIRNLQSIGRVLRKSSVKSKVYLYDICDDFRKGRKENHTYKHAIERISMYESEEFDYSIINQEIEKVDLFN